MKATVTKAFRGRPDHLPQGRLIEVGEIISGELAAVAVREGWADPSRPPAAAPQGEGGGDISRLNKDKLLELAAQRGVEVSKSDTKAEIIAALEAAAG